VSAGREIAISLVSMKTLSAAMEAVRRLARMVPHSLVWRRRTSAGGPDAAGASNDHARDGPSTVM
jgi:hypothetical protein